MDFFSFFSQKVTLAMTLFFGNFRSEQDREPAFLRTLVQQVSVPACGGFDPLQPIAAALKKSNREICCPVLVASRVVNNAALSALKMLKPFQDAVQCTRPPRPRLLEISASQPVDENTASIVSLPSELICLILGKLDFADACRLGLTCRSYYAFHCSGYGSRVESILTCYAKNQLTLLTFDKRKYYELFLPDFSRRIDRERHVLSLFKKTKLLSNDEESQLYQDIKKLYRFVKKIPRTHPLFFQICKAMLDGGDDVFKGYWNVFFKKIEYLYQGSVYDDSFRETASMIGSREDVKASLRTLAFYIKFFNLYGSTDNLRTLAASHLSKVSSLPLNISLIFQELLKNNPTSNVSLENDIFKALYESRVSRDTFEGIVRSAKKKGKLFKLINDYDVAHLSPLSIAVYKNRCDLAEILIDNGALIDGQDWQIPPLQYAVKMYARGHDDYFEMVQLLHLWDAKPSFPVSKNQKKQARINTCAALWAARRD